MNHNAGTVPFNYGDIIAITDGPIFWFQDKGTGVIRGVKLLAENGTHKLQLGDNEIIIKRAGATDPSARPGQRTPIPGSIPSASQIAANQSSAPPSKSQ